MMTITTRYFVLIVFSLAFTCIQLIADDEPAKTDASPGAKDQQISSVPDEQAKPSVPNDEKKADDKGGSKGIDEESPGEGTDSPATEAALPAGHSQHGEAFNEGPRQKAYLMGGTGSIHFEVTSEHADVQKFVEQGIGQLHGFWYFEAERSFRHATMLDPDCAIAYWGMAMANANNSKRAKGFIAEAVERKGNASRREAMFIDALSDYLNGGGKSKDRAIKYVKALEAIVAEFPDDVEVKAQLGYALYKHRSDTKRSYEDIDKALNEILAEQPLHPVHHYRIHLWDYKDAAKALNSAARCGDAAPAIAHMWHMPGHIYSRLKRYDDGAWQQEASARVDHAHMMRDRVMPDQIHNFAHNNEWLIRNLIFIGRHQDALDLAKNMTELPRHPKYNTMARRGSANYGRMRLFEVLLQYELWDELIALSDGPHLEPTDIEKEQIKRLQSLGIAQARGGYADDAQKTCEQLEELLAAATAKVEKEKAAKAEAAKKEAAKKEAEKKDAEKKDAEKKDAEKPAPKAAATPKPTASARKGRSGNSTVQTLTKAIDAINGHMALAAGDFKKSLDLLKRAGEDSMLRARVQALAGETDAAIKTAEAQVKSKTNQVLPQAAMIEIYRAAEQTEKTADAFETLRRMSGAIQFGSPVFDRLAPIAKELGLPPDWRISKSRPDDFGERPSLDSLGPFRWQPMPAHDWTLPDHNGKSHSLSSYHGKPVVVIFYLGFGCLHCVEQLQAVAPMAEKFREAGISIIAVSTDSLENLGNSIEGYEGGMPFPLVSDESLDVFKTWRVHDDFEKQPLHGTFLIDPQGYVRWQDISYEPFMDVNFLLDESKRLLAQPQVEQSPSVSLSDSPTERRRSAIRKIAASGVAGSLVLSGGEMPDPAVDSFFQLAHNKNAHIVILRAGSTENDRATTRRLYDKWESIGAASLQIVCINSPADAERSQTVTAIQNATAVWLVGDNMRELHRSLAGTKVAAECLALVQRGGVVGAAGATATIMSETVFLQDDDEDPAAGIDLFPDALVHIAQTTGNQADCVTRRLAAHPGKVGYRIEPNAALLVRGRRLRTMGEGSVTIQIAASASRPEKRIVLAGRDIADLTALRRSAAERLGPQFPPAKAAIPRVEKGTLIIVGGGGMPKGLTQRFVELAGGKKAKIVVFPTAAPDPLPATDGMAKTLKDLGAEKVTVLRDRVLNDVESDRFKETLREATGLWFGGGRQWRFADAYLDTEAQTLMHDVLARGGVIAGSSAGASIQAEYLARANPLGNRTIIAEGYERGLGFLPGAAVDQHFTQRRRQTDMTELMTAYPQMLGIGIDETTAIVVQKNIAEVVGKNVVSFYDWTQPIQDGQPDHLVVKAGQSYDLAARKLIAESREDENLADGSANKNSETSADSE